MEGGFSRRVSLVLDAAKHRRVEAAETRIVPTSPRSVPKILYKREGGESADLSPRPRCATGSFTVSIFDETIMPTR
jgi:hypothetical protein